MEQMALDDIDSALQQAANTGADVYVVLLDGRTFSGTIDAYEGRADDDSGISTGYMTSYEPVMNIIIRENNVYAIQFIS